MTQGFRITGSILTPPQDAFVLTSGIKFSSFMMGKDRKMLSPGLQKLNSGGTSWMIVTKMTAAIESSLIVNLT